MSKAKGACCAVKYSYKRRAIVYFTGVISVPADVCEQGADAVKEYVRENEPDATNVTECIVEYGDEVNNSMKVRRA